MLSADNNLCLPAADARPSLVVDDPRPNEFRSWDRVVPRPESGRGHGVWS